MKKILSIISISLLALATASAQSDDVYYSSNDNSYDQSYDNSVQDYSESFYDDLAPYGSWVNYPGYGSVWMPANVDPDFSPYLTAGHWAYSDYGWTWVSDYSWGWAAFHYGRWFHDAAYGWMWMPGAEWAPAWVTWGSYGNNYCWAPIAPGYVFDNYYRPAVSYWNFVPCEHITQPYISRYVSEHHRHMRSDEINVYHNEANDHDRHYARGPRVEEVEHSTGHRIDRMSIASSDRPSANNISGNTIQLYRPAAIRSNPQMGHGHNNIPVERNNIQRTEPAMRASGFTQRASYSEPVSMQRSQPTERNYNRPETQQFSQPARTYQESARIQRSESQQFSQPVRTYAEPARIQRAEPVQNYNRPEPQHNVQLTRTFSEPQRSFERPAAQFSSRGGRGR